MSQSTITVLIPMYNAAEHLPAALNSVLLQTRQPQQVILVDDGSQDNSVALARGFCEQFAGECKIIELKHNFGAAISRNMGLAQATSDYVAFLDADDLWASEHLEKIAGLLDRHTDAACAAGRTQLIGELAGKGVLWNQGLEDQFEYGKPKMYFWMTVERTPFQPSSVIVRRAAFYTVGNFNPNYRIAQDHEFFLRLLYRFPAVAHNEITSYWRRHVESTTFHISGQWMYASLKARCDFFRQIASSISEYACNRYQTTVRNELEYQLKSYFYSRAWKDFDAVAKARQIVPGGYRISFPWVLRRRLHALQPIWLRIKSVFVQEPPTAKETI